MPHLAVLPRFRLAVKMQVRACLRQQFRHPVHILTKKIVHLPAAIGCGIAKAESGQNPRQLRELAGGASFDRPVEGIVRARCHFVEQQPAISGDEELYRQKANQIDGLGKGRCRGLRRFGHSRDDRRRSDASRQNAIPVTVLRRREVTDCALGIAGQQGADFAIKADQLLQNGVITVD